MNAQKPGLSDRVAASRWRKPAIAFVLLYCPLLAIVLATMSFSAENLARQYIAQVADRPAVPPPGLPAWRSNEWPDISLQRDPFQPLAPPTNRVPSKSERVGAIGKTAPSASFFFVASYRDVGQPYVFGRDRTGELARFRIGDRIDGAVIEHIDSDHVTLNSGGQQRVIEILRDGRGVKKTKDEIDSP